MPCGVIWHLDVKVTDWQGKKINSKRPVPAKASGEVARGVGKSRIGALADQRDEAKHGVSTQSLCQGILALRDARGRNQPPPRASFPIPCPPGGVWDPLQEQTPTPSQEGGSGQSLGIWGSPTLSEVSTSHWFFSVPVQDEEKGNYSKKLFLSWPLGEKKQS